MDSRGRRGTNGSFKRSSVKRSASSGSQKVRGHSWTFHWTQHIWSQVSKCPSQNEWGQSSIWPWKGWEQMSTGDTDNRWLCYGMLTTTSGLLVPEVAPGVELVEFHTWPLCIRIQVDFSRFHITMWCYFRVTFSLGISLFKTSSSLWSQTPRCLGL